jgi:hypothetical protein
MAIASHVGVIACAGTKWRLGRRIVRLNYAMGYSCCGVDGTPKSARFCCCVMLRLSRRCYKQAINVIAPNMCNLMAFIRIGL